jgi:hypothetical protein
LLASLESELSDSASLCYLRLRSLCERVARGGKSLHLRQKKQKGYPKLGILFVAKERLKGA